MLLQTHDLCFAIDHTLLLDGVNLGVEEGEIHALVGANGAGKTVLARVLMGCEGYSPSSGKIFFCGKDITALPIHERARLGMTMAWQQPARFEGLSVRDYLRLGGQDVDVDALLAQVGLPAVEYGDRMVDRSLSGGERKRIELAAVLGLRPRLAILDEPVAGIDALSVDSAVRMIEKFRDGGASVLLITHRERFARVADRASQLCGGRIVCSGDPGVVADRYMKRRCVRCDGRTCDD
ncbi:MAG: ATP-binding cassette domain-containing protein [Myxococcales bacterium]|jgi:Fe-S cluster assembly ATP-binding protein